jgi:hypothetical protein
MRGRVGRTGTGRRRTGAASVTAGGTIVGRATGGAIVGRGTGRMSLGRTTFGGTIVRRTPGGRATGG